jgi:hypothetical protein
MRRETPNQDFLSMAEQRQDVSLVSTCQPADSDPPLALDKFIEQTGPSAVTGRASRPSAGAGRAVLSERKAGGFRPPR